MQANLQKYTVLFQEDKVRLYEIEKSRLTEPIEEAQVYPLPKFQINIEPAPAIPQKAMTVQPQLSLAPLEGTVSQDSLESYTYRLQAFYRRVTGSDSAVAARNWIRDNFISFGYDSVVFDTFATSPVSANVLAYKTGTTYPDFQIIVGAHFDGVAISPAADDNGSGTAGVLEIARVLHDWPTRVSFVFALFEGEEQGLIGSTHYANEAKARGDSIVYMLNMDMIAQITNNSEANLYYGADLTYSQLWADLADSLFGITASFRGSSSGSDHYPFVQNGYKGTFVQEGIFSTVYHTARDSTSFMNFEYMTRMVKASLATVYVADDNFAPTGTLAFSYPNGTPDMVPPRQATSVDVDIAGTFNVVIDPAAVNLHYSVNGANYLSGSMSQVSPGRFHSTLPSLDCLSRIKYFITASDTSGKKYYSPDSAYANEAVAAAGADTIFADNFETNKGWTVSGTAVAGLWNRGRPAGGGDRGDPPTDYDGSGKCYVTDTTDGDTDVDNGTTYLDSPVFDLSGGDARIHYGRWYSNSFGSAPFSDVMRVYISNNNGVNWYMAELIGPIIQASGGWFEHSFWAGDFVPLSSQMRIRFDVGDLGAGSVVEAAVDAVSITGFNCKSFVCGDVNGGGIVNILDVTFLINFLYKDGQPPDPMEAADANGNGDVNVLDITYLINFLYKGGPEPICP